MNRPALRARVMARLDRDLKKPKDKTFYDVRAMIDTMVDLSIDETLRAVADDLAGPDAQANTKEPTQEVIPGDRFECLVDGPLRGRIFTASRWVEPDQTWTVEEAPGGTFLVPLQFSSVYRKLPLKDGE